MGEVCGGVLPGHVFDDNKQRVFTGSWNAPPLTDSLSWHCEKSTKLQLSCLTHHVCGRIRPEGRRSPCRYGTID